MIKAVLWDLGDVLCHFRPDRRVREIARCSGASEHDVRALLTAELLGRLDVEVVPIAVFSGHTRLVKPDALSFVNACAVLNAVPSDVLLVDDSETNVAAASSAGLRTHRYRNAAELERLLDQEHLLRLRCE